MERDGASSKRINLMDALRNIVYSIVAITLLLLVLHFLQAMENNITISVHESHDGYVVRATHSEGKPILCQVCQRPASVFIMRDGKESFYCVDHKPLQRFLIY